MADEIGEGWSLGLDEGAEIETENHLRDEVGLCGVGKSGLGVAST